MSLFVLDSSVAIKWVLPEEHSDKALALRDEIARGIHQIIAPDVFASEIAHTLTRAERKNIIAVGEASKLVSDILLDGPDLRPFLPLLPSAIEISSATKAAITDCIFMALAEREKCEFITADKRVTITLAGFPILPLSSL